MQQKQGLAGRRFGFMADFNLISGTKLAPQEKQDLVAFLRAL